MTILDKSIKNLKTGLNKDITISDNIVKIFEYASQQDFNDILKFVFCISNNGNKEENVKNTLATILPFYYKSDKKLYKKFNMYFLLIELINISIRSFAGKTLLTKIDKNIYNKEFVDYQMLCLKNKSIFILDEYSGKKYLIKITVNIKNFGNWFEELKVYPIKEIDNKIEIGYESFLYDSEIINDLPPRYLNGYKSFNSLTSHFSIQGYTNLYKSLLEILPEQYCHYCHADPRLKKDYNEETYLSKGTLEYKGKGDSCIICKQIFEQIKNFRYRHIKDHKTGEFEIIEFRNKNNKNDENDLDYENILCSVNSRCKKIKKIDETFYKQKQKIVGECILTYDAIGKILEEKLSFWRTIPDIDEYMKNYKPEFMNINFYKFVTTVKYHFGIEKDSKQAYFEHKYLYPVRII